MKIKHLLFVFLITLFAASACKTLMTYANILSCEFRMKSLNNTQLAGVSVQSIKSFSDLNFAQAGRLTTAYLSGNVPLTFQLNVEGKNPNATEATMARFDWILLIDDKQMATGTNQQEFRLPGNNGTQVIPLNISINLMEVLNNETKNSLLNFAFNLADAGSKPTRVGLKIKPTVYLNTMPITYPNYLDLGTEFGGAN